MILSGSIRTPDDVTIGPARSRQHKLIIMEPNGVPLSRLGPDQTSRQVAFATGQPARPFPGASRRYGSGAYSLVGLS